MQSEGRGKRSETTETVTYSERDKERTVATLEDRKVKRKKGCGISRIEASFNIL